MFFLAFFTPLMPLVIPIGIVGLLIFYWVDKIEIIKGCKQPSYMTASLFYNMMDYIEYFVLIIATGNLYFTLRL